MADLCALAWLYLFSRVYQALDSSLESTFSKKDSASGEQCGSVAKIAKGTTAKFANLPQFLQSSHSPTAKPAIAVQGEAAAGFFRNLRILEEEKQAQSKNAPTLSSRDLPQQVVAIHTESTFSNGDLACGLESQIGVVDCALGIHKASPQINLQANLESSVAKVDSIECHAHKLAYNDRDNTAGKKRILVVLFHHHSKQTEQIKQSIKNADSRAMVAA